jgi:hypothetical protein
MNRKELKCAEHLTLSWESESLSTRGTSKPFLKGILDKQSSETQEYIILDFAAEFNNAETLDFSVALYSDGIFYFTAIWYKGNVTGGWRELQMKKFHSLYSSPNIIRMMKSSRVRWPAHISRMGETISVYKILVGRPEWKWLLRRSRRTWEDNIKMYFKEVRWEDLTLIYVLGQGLISCSCGHGNEASGFIKGGAFLN